MQDIFHNIYSNTNLNLSFRLLNFWFLYHLLFITRNSGELLWQRLYHVAKSVSVDDQITVGLGALANLFLGVYEAIDEDSKVPDLLIVVGSSLEVRPVAKIPYDIPQNIPQILINREPHHYLNFDIELLRRWCNFLWTSPHLEQLRVRMFNF